MPATFGDLRSEVDDLRGLGVTPTERDRLLNEGHLELVVRAEYLKGVRTDFGPAVDGQEEYAFPASVRRPLEVAVGGYPRTNSDQQSIRDIRNGDLDYTGRGFWYIAYASDGTRKLGIYPTAATGTEIAVLSLLEPPEMTADDDEPAVPSDFRGAIVDYVAMVALGGVEDAIEDRIFHRDEFNRQVERLAAYAREIEGGDGVAQIRVRGVTA